MTQARMDFAAISGTLETLGVTVQGLQVTVERFPDEGKLGDALKVLFGHMDSADAQARMTIGTVYNALPPVYGGRKQWCDDRLGLGRFPTAKHCGWVVAGWIGEGAQCLPADVASTILSTSSAPWWLFETLAPCSPKVKEYWLRQYARRPFGRAFLRRQVSLSKDQPDEPEAPSEPAPVGYTMLVVLSEAEVLSVQTWLRTDQAAAVNAHLEDVVHAHIGDLVEKLRQIAEEGEVCNDE